MPNMSDQNTLTFSDATFSADILGSDIPVLVSFWAHGCGGCQRLAPLIDMVAREYAGRVKVGKLDAMSNSVTATKYNILALPIVLVFKGGNVVEQRVGLIAEVDLRRMLESHL
jgi:thioredoxin 1